MRVKGLALADLHERQIDVEDFFQDGIVAVVGQHRLFEVGAVQTQAVENDQTDLGRHVLL